MWGLWWDDSGGIWVWFRISNEKEIKKEGYEWFYYGWVCNLFINLKIFLFVIYFDILINEIYINFV